jgi:hypothetical protein
MSRSIFSGRTAMLRSSRCHMCYSNRRSDRPDHLTQDETDRIDIEDARAALKEAEEKGTIPLRELMRELGD